MPIHEGPGPRRPVLLAICLGLAIPAPALLAQFAPAGAEIRVNTTTVGQQALPRAAALPVGFVVVWQTGAPGSMATDVEAQRYDAGGAAVGAEFRVNTYTPGCQRAPDVAAAADGSFVVVWQSEGEDGSGQGVYAQRFAANGTPAGGEVLVNVTTAGDQQAPRVAYDPAGSAFTVAWESFGQDGDGWGVFARRFDPSGPLTGEILLSATTAGDQRHPALAVQPTGEIAVAWESPDGSGPGISVRRFTSALSPLTGEVRANTATSGFQTGPALGADASGNLVAVWESSGQDGGASGVYAQRFDRSLTPFSGELRANATTAGLQGRPAVAVFPSGDFLIAWESWTQDQGGPGVFARRFDILGQPAGPELQVNTFSPGVQRRPALAAGRTGALLAAWESLGQDGDGAGVYAQRYALAPLDYYTLTPCRLFDTRQTAHLANGSVRTFAGAGLCAIPPAARAISINLSATAATGNGYVAVYPADAAAPVTSSLNFLMSLTRSNNAIVPLARNGTGTIAVRSVVEGSPGLVDLIVDVNGYFQ
jgi:hypothetical protein